MLKKLMGMLSDPGAFFESIRPERIYETVSVHPG